MRRSCDEPLSHDALVAFASDASAGAIVTAARELMDRRQGRGPDLEARNRGIVGGVGRRRPARRRDGRMTSREPLTDGHGRAIGDVRVSVTDRCNFRCQYCMPAEGLPWLKRDEILTFEEIERLVGLLVAMGVRDVRLTGGEPLVRRDLPDLVARIAAIDGWPISRSRRTDTCSSSRPRRSSAPACTGSTCRSTRCSATGSSSSCAATPCRGCCAGLQALGALCPGAIKVNAVALRGFTETEILPLARFAREHPYEVRFIEFMPLDADRAWTPDMVLTGAEVRAAIEAVHPLEPLEREPSATATIWRFADGRGRIGFINPVSEPFCSDCNRIRLTAEGALRTCLFSMREHDLRGPLRNGASDDDLEQLIRDAVWAKELKHRVNDPGFVQPARTMSAIGG